MRVCVCYEYTAQAGAVINDGVVDQQSRVRPFTGAFLSLRKAPSGRSAPTLLLSLASSICRNRLLVKGGM
jgi:hypothetical protein